jgi:hypothetical protein
MTACGRRDQYACAGDFGGYERELLTEQQTIDAASGVRLIGGEVMTRDLPQVTHPGSIAYLFSRLLESVEGDVLLLGAKAASLLDVVRPHRQVDIQVRSLPDARDLASRAQEREHLRIFCGGFERFAPTATYDIVVCLDGPEGLLTPDSEPLSHADTIQGIGRHLSDNGQALLAIANDLGIDNVFRLDMRTLFDADASWYRGADGYDQRRAIFPELDELVTRAGLQPAQAYCGYPSFDLMSLLVTPEVADDRAARAGVQSLIARIENQAHRSGPSLVDLYAMSRRFLEAGMARQTAPGWLLLVTKGGVSAPEIPDLVLSEDGTGREWASIMTASHREGDWRRDVISLAGSDSMIERRVMRDLSAVGSLLPDGELLEPMLRAECERGNLTGVRRLVRAYADFITDTESGEEIASRRFFAVPGNVVVSGDGGPREDLLTYGSMSLFDASWSWAEDLSPELALARGLRDFARRLLQSGCEHPWQPDISPDALAQTLLAMVGRTWSDVTATEVARREAELEVVLHGGGPTVESTLLAENIASGASQFTATSAPSRGYREALSSVGRMSQELHERGDQVEWLEASLRQRDQRVNDLQGELQRVKSSSSFVLGRRLTAPVRTVRDRSLSRARNTALQMLPPQLVRRADRALRRAGL